MGRSALSRRAFAGGVALIGAAACARALPAGARPTDSVVLVSPPNPHVFPLLLAMARNPDLAVRLAPVAESREADALLQSGGAAGMLAMSYIAAKKRVTRAVPDLMLYSLNFWRGFYQVAGEDVRSFADLRGKRVVVSGPVGNGQGGGGDIIFQAAARRVGLDPASDLDVAYMPLAAGSAAVASGEAAAITIPSPGSTGLVTRSLFARRPAMAAMARLRGVDVGASVPLAAHIDMQRIFSGFASFPDGQLPLGGMAVTERAFADSDTRQKLEAIKRAYDEASALLSQNPGAHAQTVSSLFQHHYASLGAGGPPAMLFERAITQGDLVYRADVQIAQVRADLGAWITELISETPEASFFGV